MLEIKATKRVISMLPKIRVRMNIIYKIVKAGVNRYACLYQ